MSSTFCLGFHLVFLTLASAASQFHAAHISYDYDLECFLQLKSLYSGRLAAVSLTDFRFFKNL